MQFRLNLIALVASVAQFTFVNAQYCDAYSVSFCLLRDDSISALFTLLLL